MEEEKDIKMYVGNLSTDDRGTLRFVNDFHFEDVKRFYQVENHEAGFIRAWHGHKKEGKYVYVVKGSILLGIISMDQIVVKQYVLSSTKPQILFIPPGNFNGFKTLEPNTIVLFFSTVSLEESRDDDYRRSYNEFKSIFTFDVEYR